MSFLGIGLPLRTASIESFDGYRIGDLGEGAYDGLILRDAYNFNNLNGFITPTNPFGTFSHSVGYNPAHSGHGGLSSQTDTEPKWTGYNDSNHGVAVGFDNIYIENGDTMVIQARQATAGELPHITSTSAQVAGAIDFAQRHSFNPGAAGTGDILLEVLSNIQPKSLGGWHPTAPWQVPSSVAGAANQGFEGDFEVGVLQGGNWNAGSRTPTAASLLANWDSGAFHWDGLYSNTSAFALWRDGVSVKSIAISANSQNIPSSGIYSNHIRAVDVDYSASDWINNPNGQTLKIKTYRLWGRVGAAFYRPLTTLPQYDVDYGDSLDIVVPSKLALWGDGSVSEKVHHIIWDENAPGGAPTGNGLDFPSIVTWNSGTRTLSVVATSGKAGRIHILVEPYSAGSIAFPLVIIINIGPRLPNAVVLYKNQSNNLDLFNACQSGVLTSDENGARAKTVEINSGLPSGCSYDDIYITGNPPAYGVTV